MTTKIQPTNIDATLDYSVHKLTVSGVDVLAYAQSSFALANTTTLNAGGASDYANGAFVQANASFVQANTGVTNAATADSKAVSAGSYANSAYTQANTATTNASTADSKAVSAGSYANAAFITANTAYAWGNHATYSYATETYVGTQISNLVNSAPTTLDTLNELATALGNDANFSTTVATNIGVAHNKANAAFIQANTGVTDAAAAGSYANSAYTQANTGVTNALAASTYANSAFLHANAAFAAANSGGGGGGGSSYTDANVAAYLPTYTGNLASNILTANSATIGTPNYGSFLLDGTNGISSASVWTDAEKAAKWTFSCWMYIPSSTYNPAINGPLGILGANSPYLGFTYGYDGASTYRFVFTARQSQVATRNLSGALATNTWHFISLSYDNTLSKLYIGVNGTVTEHSFGISGTDYTGFVMGLSAAGQITGANVSGPVRYTDVSLITGTTLYNANYTVPNTHPTSVSGQKILLLAKTSDNAIYNEVSSANLTYYSTTPSFVSSTPLLISGNITSYGVISATSVTATTLSGDGSALTNLNAPTLVQGNVIFSQANSAFTQANAAFTKANTISYPSSGIANSNGSAWSTSYSTTGSGTVLSLNTTPIITNPTITNYVETPYVVNSSTALTIDLGNGTVQVVTLTGSPTITMPTAVAGKSFIMYMKTGSGSYTVTWSTVKWPSGTAPTITSTGSRMDIFSFFSDGTNWYGTTVGQNYTP